MGFLKNTPEVARFTPFVTYAYKCPISFFKKQPLPHGETYGKVLPLSIAMLVTLQRFDCS
jgi:hypothetical protein